MKHVLVLVLVLAALACDRAPKNQPAPPVPAPSVQPPVAATESEGATPPEADRITRFGVPDCDNYVKKYLDCVEGKVSGEQKKQLMEAFEANRTKWRALATMREGAIALGLACRAAAQKSREELTVDYGCDF